ncbi:MAG: hypothetical protein ACTSYI_11575 [Promethearchaeota archaeon]
MKFIKKAKAIFGIFIVTSLILEMGFFPIVTSDKNKSVVSSFLASPSKTGKGAREPSGAQLNQSYFFVNATNSTEFKQWNQVQFKFSFYHCSGMQMFLRENSTLKHFGLITSEYFTYSMPIDTTHDGTLLIGIRIYNHSQYTSPAYLEIIAQIEITIIPDSNKESMPDLTEIIIVIVSSILLISIIYIIYKSRQTQKSPINYLFTSNKPKLQKKFTPFFEANPLVSRRDLKRIFYSIQVNQDVIDFSIDDLSDDEFLQSIGSIKL